MLNEKRLDLQFFAEGASAGDGGASGVSPAAAGQSTGANAAAAGQSTEARLEALGVPKDKIRKGAFKGKAAETAADKTEPAATPPAAAQEAETPESGAADRKSWDEIKSDYKSEYDAEVQDTIRRRVKSERDRTQRYIDRESARAPMDMFFAERYQLDPESPDFYEKMVERFRADSSLSQSSAIENGLDDEIEHKLKVAKADEDVAKFKERREKQLQVVFDKAREQKQKAQERLDELIKQSTGLEEKIPGFDLMREFENDAFVELVSNPKARVTVEQAYYALHPEFWERKAQAIAQRASEAVAASVRAGAARPAENGSQAASVGRTPYSEMPREQREDLKRRIREAAYEGKHILPGG